MRLALACMFGASLLALPACDGGEAREETTTPEPPVAVVVTVTMTEDGCEYAGSRSVPDGRFTLELVKETSGEGSFEPLRIVEGATFDDLAAHITREHERRQNGLQTLGYQSLAALEASAEVLEEDHQTVISPQPADLEPGTHAVLCIQPSRMDLAGPLVLTP